MSETKDVIVMAAAGAAIDDNNNATGWLISNILYIPASMMLPFQKESMVGTDRDIKDICHVVSLCINIKKAEGRKKEKGR